MSDVEMTLRMPDTLIERAKALGLTDEEMSGILQAEVERREAAQYLDRLTERLTAMTANGRPSHAQWDEFITQAHAERTPAIQSEAGRRMKEIAEKLHSIEPKLTLEEINEEIRLAREEMRHTT